MDSPRWRVKFTGTQGDGREHSTVVEGDRLIRLLWLVASHTTSVHFQLRPWRRSDLARRRRDLARRLDDAGWFAALDHFERRIRG